MTGTHRKDKGAFAFANDVRKKLVDHGHLRGRRNEMFSQILHNEVRYNFNQRPPDGRRTYGSGCAPGSM